MMYLFKDPVALEACPAKTAESVSYAATLSVLAVLLVTNYSSFGHIDGAEKTVVYVQKTDAEPLIAETTDVDFEPLPGSVLYEELQYEAARFAPALTPIVTSYIVTSYENNNAISVARHHHNLQPFVVNDLVSAPKLEPLARRVFSAEELPEIADTVVVLESFNLNKALDIQPAMAQTGFTTKTDKEFDAEERKPPGLDLLFTTEIASTATAPSSRIHQITVNGTEPDKPLNRPHKIQRPQLPRPYRAQAIQRTLILPPRVQALRP